VLEQEELILRAKDGNKSALNSLFQLNYKMIFGFAIKMTGNETLAQDITQETFLKAVLNIKKFNCNCKFSTWLIKISINLYKDYMKKNKNIEFKEDIIPTEHSESMEEMVMMNLQYKEAIEELKKMSYKKRTSFILKHYYGYSLEEISEIMECPQGTVKSRISNCVDSLRKVLKEGLG
jgi:RNA polymerase sigma-70 factor (ECF subfamily)